MFPNLYSNVYLHKLLNANNRENLIGLQTVQVHVDYSCVVMYDIIFGDTYSFSPILGCVPKLCETSLLLVSTESQLSFSGCTLPTKAMVLQGIQFTLYCNCIVHGRLLEACGDTYNSTVSCSM